MTYDGNTTRHDARNLCHGADLWIRDQEGANDHPLWTTVGGAGDYNVHAWMSP